MAKQFTYITLEEEPETVVLNKKDVLKQLKDLGIRKGMVLLVQANTKQMGHLIGGEQMLIEALMESVGYEGTIVVPTFTTELLDPACQKNKKEKIVRMYWNDVRTSALPFDKKLTLPKDEDPFVCQFLRNEGIVRSYHPVYSFAAWGKYAKVICHQHPLHFGLNEDSPVGKVLDYNGYVVSLGCGYDECVIFRHAQYKYGKLPIRIISAPIENNNLIQWKDMLDIECQNEEISKIGNIMEDKCVVKSSFIGATNCTFFSSKEAVSIAITYFKTYKDDMSISTN